MFRCGNILLMFVAFLLLPFCLEAQISKKELENKRKKIQEEIFQTEKLIRETKKNKTLTLAQLKVLSKKIEDRKRLIQAIQYEITALNSSIISNDKEVNQLQTRLSIMRENYAHMLREAYMQQNQQTMMMLIFSSKDIHQAYKRMHYLRVFNERLKTEAKKMRDYQLHLNNHISELRSNLTDKQTLLGSEEREKKELNQEKIEQENAVIQLKKREGLLKKDLAKKQADKRKLNAEIQRVIEREIAKEKAKAMKVNNISKGKAVDKPSKTNVSKETKPTIPDSEIPVTPETRIISGKFESNKGRLPWPVSKGVITESFGSHPHPVLKNIVTLNNGIDIGTSRGETVKTIFEGEVSGVITVPGANDAVIVKHGEYLTVYSNLEFVSVQRGSKVQRGQSIGVAATDPYEGKTETHLEIWKGKTKLNPAEWISR